MWTKLFPTRRPQRPARARPGRRSIQLSLETLESRLVPTNYHWITATPGTYYWDDANNWLDDASPPNHGVPGPDDSAYIKENFDVVVRIRTPVTVERVFSDCCPPSDTVDITSTGALTVTAGASQITRLTLAMGGGLTLQNPGTTMRLGDSDQRDLGTVLAGAINVSDGAAQIQFVGSHTIQFNRGLIFSGAGRFIQNAPVQVNARVTLGNSWELSTSSSDLDIEPHVTVTSGTSFHQSGEGRVYLHGNSAQGNAKFLVPKDSTVTLDYGGGGGSGFAGDNTSTNFLDVHGTVDLNTSDLFLTNVTINNRKSACWNWQTGGDDDFIAGGGNGLTFHNNGEFNIAPTADRGVFNFAEFDNTGMVDQTGDHPYGITFSGNQFNNSGTVAIQAGTMNVNAASVDAGTYNVATGSTLAFGGSGISHTLDTGSQVNGAGTLGVTQGATVNANGTSTISNLAVVYGRLNLNPRNAASFTHVQVNSSDSATLNVEASISVGALYLGAGGILTGASTLDATAAMDWTGGTIQGTTFTLILDPDATMTIEGTAGKTLNGSTVDLCGTANWSGGSIALPNPATIDVETGGTFNILSDGINLTGSGIFRNLGLVTKQNLPGATQIVSGIAFFNDARLSIGSGILEIDNFTQYTGQTEIAGGARLQSSGATLALQGGELSGSGTVMVNNGNGTVHNVAGTVRPGGDGVISTLTIAGNYTNEALGAVTIDIANSGAYDRLIVTGTVTLNGGTMNGNFLPGYMPTDGDSFMVLRSQRGVINGTPGDFSVYTVNGLDSSFHLTHMISGGCLTLTVSAVGNAPGTGGRQLRAEAVANSVPLAAAFFSLGHLLVPVAGDAWIDNAFVELAPWEC